MLLTYECRLQHANLGQRLPDVASRQRLLRHHYWRLHLLDRLGAIISAHAAQGAVYYRLHTSCWLYGPNLQRLFHCRRGCRLLR